jgi:CRISPR/Cas system-associated protein Cas5 (RAMP superfamily)
MSGKHEIVFNIKFEGIAHIGHRESMIAICAVQRCRAKAFKIKEANYSACLLNFYSHIPSSEKK